MTPAGLAIRVMRASDAEQAARVDSAGSAHPWTAAQFAEELGAAARTGLAVVTDTDNLIAFLLLQEVAGEVEVLNLAVAPAWRRQGVGSWLLTDGLRRAQQAGAVVAHLDVRAGNQAARALYLRLGFTEVGRRRGYYQPDGDDAVLMTADLRGAR